MNDLAPNLSHRRVGVDVKCSGGISHPSTSYQRGYRIADSHVQIRHNEGEIKGPVTIALFRYIVSVAFEVFQGAIGGIT